MNRLLTVGILLLFIAAQAHRPSLLPDDAPSRRTTALILIGGALMAGGVWLDCRDAWRRDRRNR
jgi:hypothetical protein